MIEYAKAQVLEDGQWDLTLDIKNVAKLLEKETFRTQLKKIKDKSLEEIIEVKNNLIQENIKLKKEILESAKTIEQLLATTNFTESDFSNKTFPNYLFMIKTFGTLYSVFSAQIAFSMFDNCFKLENELFQRRKEQFDKLFLT